MIPDSSYHNKQHSGSSHASHPEGLLPRITKSHRNHIITPCIHGSLYRTILLLRPYHVKQPPTEITVTGSCNGRHQRQGRPMRVAAHPKTGIHKAMIARIGCLRSNNPLLQESQRLSSLESRSRWELPHNRTVQQWFPTVTRQFQMILPRWRPTINLGSKVGADTIQSISPVDGSIATILPIFPSNRRSPNI